MTTKYYRPDIDGLRAIAVLGVILFHAGLPISGGFVGVDVFFVISGYLITQIILRESSEQRFSLMNFWMRRIRRILPAAAVVTLTTIFVGYFIFDQSSFISLGKAAIAQSLMMANVLFWRRSNYFSESSELEPLLHTWSLSVEEQFYMIFPLLLVFLLRKTRCTFIILAVAAFASLLLSSIGAYTHPSATFYLLPTRAWELAAGALLAIFETRLAIRRVAKELMAVAGLGAIVLPMAIYSDSTSFPGLAALPPVAGTVILLAANRGSATFVGRALSLKPVVAIGLASYSLYLWHWPILVFLKHTLVRQSALSTMAALAGTAVLSYISWRFVEVPFRSSKRLRTPRAAFTFGALASSAVIAAGMLVWFQQGIPSRINTELVAIQDDITWNGIEYESDSPSGVAIGAPRLDAKPPDFVLWGDSHGMAVAELVDSLAREHDISGVAFLSSGRPPITGLWKPLKGLEQEKETTTLNQARLDKIIQSGTKDVILIGRWDGMIRGMLPTEIDERNGIPKTYNMVVDSAEETPSYETSRDALARQFSKMLKELESKQIRVSLLLQVPSASRSRVARDFYISKRFPLLNPKDFSQDTSREEYASSRMGSKMLFSGLEAKNLSVIDPIESFYNNGNRLSLYSSRAFYRDEDHLTRPGAEHYLRPVISNILSNIRPSASANNMPPRNNRSTSIPNQTANKSCLLTGHKHSNLIPFPFQSRP